MGYMFQVTGIKQPAAIRLASDLCYLSSDG